MEVPPLAMVVLTWSTFETPSTRHLLAVFHKMGMLREDTFLSLRVVKECDLLLQLGLTAPLHSISSRSVEVPSVQAEISEQKTVLNGPKRNERKVFLKEMKFQHRLLEAVTSSGGGNNLQSCIVVV